MSVIRGSNFLGHVLLLCRIILETDANVIAGKVASNSIDSGAPLSEQVFHNSWFSSPIYPVQP